MNTKCIKVACFMFLLISSLFVVGCEMTPKEGEKTETPAETVKNDQEKGSYDSLAKCLTEKGTKLYGAFWCGHCKAQKEMFGDSFQYVSYVECDEGGESGNPEACETAGIRGYPTWVFSNGSTLSGRQKFETLAGKTGCAIDEKV